VPTKLFVEHEKNQQSRKIADVKADEIQTTAPSFEEDCWIPQQMVPNISKQSSEKEEILAETQALGG
jgi:hypothetical protein